MTPYERVQQSRQLTAATFPLPSVLDCIRYAITELAEYDDALLRAERTGDKRNNDKAHDPRSELGQALYMLLSAAAQLNAPPLPVLNLPAARNRRVAYTGALRALANALDDVALADARQVMLPDSPFSSAYTHLIILVSFLPKNDVGALIDDTCAAFERKHAPAEVR